MLYFIKFQMVSQYVRRLIEKLDNLKQDMLSIERALVQFALRLACSCYAL